MSQSHISLLQKQKIIYLQYLATRSYLPCIIRNNECNEITFGHDAENSFKYIDTLIVISTVMTLWLFYLLKIKK